MKIAPYALDNRGKLRQHSPIDTIRYQLKKRAEGKPNYVCMTAGCNKFLRIYYDGVKEFRNTLDTPVDLDSTGLFR